MAEEVDLLLYGTLHDKLYQGDLDLDAGEITCALMGTGYTFEFDQELFTEIEEDEVDDEEYPDYSRQVITNNTVIYDPAENPRAVTFDADDVNFGDQVTIDARFAVLFATGEDHNQELIACVDFLEERGSVDGAFEIQWHEDGIFEVEVPDQE